MTAPAPHPARPPADVLMEIRAGLIDAYQWRDWTVVPVLIERLRKAICDV